jgi:uncharacterized protein (TIRG00374 family)
VPSRRTLLRWGLRVAGLALVIFVLVTQVRWRDTLTLTDGTVLTGRVEVLSDGGYHVEEGAVPGTHGVKGYGVAAERVARRDLAGRSVPDVVLGLPSLAARLAGRAPVVAIVLLVLAAVVVLTAWRWQRLLRALDLRLPFGQAARLSWIGLFFNIAIPGATGGDVVKAFYAARVLGAPTRAVVSVFVDRVLGLLALVLLAGGAVLLAPSDPAYDTPKRLVLLCLAGALVGGAVVLSRRLRRALGLAALLRRLPFAHVLAEADAALRLYRKKPREVGFALLLSLGNHVGFVVAAWLLAGALGMRDLGLAPLFVVVPLASLIGAVPLLPGGWGVGEVAYAWLLQPFGVAATEAVSLSVLLRLANLVVGLPGGVLWGLWRDAPSRETLAAEVDRAVHQLERQEATGRAPVPAPENT